MADDINTLLGLGLTSQDDMKALANSLRNEQAIGDYFSTSTTPEWAKYGQNMQSRTSDAAKTGGVLRQSMAKEKTRQSERDQDYTRGLAANKLKQKNALDLQQAKQREPQTYKPGNPDLYENIKDPKQKARLYFDPDTRKYRKVGDGTVADMKEWRVPGETEEFKFADIGDMDDQRSAYDNLVELSTTFEEGFATAKDSNIPFENTAKVALGRMFPALTSEEMATSGEWWRDLDKFYNLSERHELFGGALTKGETQSWARANINRESTPEQVLRSLQKLIDKKGKKIKRRASAFKASGFNNNAIEALWGDVLNPPKDEEVITVEFGDL